MLRRDFFLVASTAAISSLLTYLTCVTLTTPPEARRYEIGAIDGAHMAPLNSFDGDALAVDAGILRPKIVSASRQDSTQPDRSDHSGSSTAQDPVLAFQKRQELGERFSRLFDSASNPPSSTVGAEVENRFYSEEWNQAWAGSKEGKIRALFDDNQDLNGITPLQVTCRSKNCQVVFSASTQEQVQAVSEKFMQAATRNDVGMKDKVVSFFPDVPVGRLVFYLSENGNIDLFE